MGGPVQALTRGISPLIPALVSEQPSAGLCGQVDSGLTPPDSRSEA